MPVDESYINRLIYCVMSYLEFFESKMTGILDPHSVVPSLFPQARLTVSVNLSK
jgi:hypothetical protein